MNSPFARFAAAVLLAWQAIVVQAHVHAPHAAARGAAASHGEARLSSVPDRPDSPGDCPVCREVAHTGQYVAPGPLLYAPPARLALWLSPAAALVQAGGQRSHSWRSRAPPAPPVS